jgi:multidrug efflux pump subunit AcrA (membrane-fusion protein)
VPERDAPLAGSGDSARITLQALPGETFEESVSRVAGTMDERTRTMLVQIDLPNPDGRLLPGMFRQAAIALEPSRERITRPANVVRFGGSSRSRGNVTESRKAFSGERQKGIYPSPWYPSPLPFPLRGACEGTIESADRL